MERTSVYYLYFKSKGLLQKLVRYISQ